MAKFFIHKFFSEADLKFCVCYICIIYALYLLHVHYVSNFWVEMNPNGNELQCQIFSRTKDSESCYKNQRSHVKTRI